MPLLVPAPEVDPEGVVEDEEEEPAVAPDCVVVLVEGYVEGEVLVLLEPEVPAPAEVPEVVPDPVLGLVAEDVLSLVAPDCELEVLEDGDVEEEPELVLGDFG